MRLALSVFLVLSLAFSVGVLGGSLLPREPVIVVETKTVEKTTVVYAANEPDVTKPWAKALCAFDVDGLLAAAPQVITDTPEIRERAAQLKAEGYSCVARFVGLAPGPTGHADAYYSVLWTDASGEELYRARVLHLVNNEIVNIE